MPLASEDPLTYLPRKPLQEYAKGSEIYDLRHANEHLYVVIRGLVKVSNADHNGYQTIGRIVATEGLFGESCLIGAVGRSEWAVALDHTALMSWSSAEVVQHIEREPRLGVALSQFLIRQCLKMEDRIESMAVHKTPERIMLALLQLAADFGVPTADDQVRVVALTHHTIAEFVGTSREIVTFQLNRLRRAGLIRYSRQYLDINVDAMERQLREKSARIPMRTEGPARGAAG